MCSSSVLLSRSAFSVQERGCYFQYLLSFSGSEIFLLILGVWLERGNCKDDGRTHESERLCVALGENQNHFKGKKFIWEKDKKMAFLSGGLTYLKGRPWNRYSVKNVIAPSPVPVRVFLFSSVYLPQCKAFAKN